MSLGEADSRISLLEAENKHLRELFDRSETASSERVRLAREVLEEKLAATRWALVFVMLVVLALLGVIISGHH